MGRLSQPPNRLSAARITWRLFRPDAFAKQLSFRDILLRSDYANPHIYPLANVRIHNHSLFFLGFDLCKGGDGERMPAVNPQSQKKYTAPKTVVAKTIYRPNLAMLTTNTNRQRGSRITPAASVIGSPIIGTHEAKRLIQPQR